VNVELYIINRMNTKQAKRVYDKQFYIVVSGDEYGGYWSGKSTKRDIAMPSRQDNKTRGNEIKGDKCDNCGNKHFIPRLFVERHAAEEYLERYLNSYVDCFNENNDDIEKSDCCWCKVEIQICEIQAPSDDMECRFFITVSGAPYGGAFKTKCFECNGTEFLMRIFNDKEEAEKYVDDYKHNVAAHCKSCMYNYDIDVILLHAKS
jgi:hypothetical protein